MSHLTKQDMNSTVSDHWVADIDEALAKARSELEADLGESLYRTAKVRGKIAALRNLLAHVSALANGAQPVQGPPAQESDD